MFACLVCFDFLDDLFLEGNCRKVLVKHDIFTQPRRGQWKLTNNKYHASDVIITNKKSSFFQGTHCLFSKIAFQ